MDGEKRRRKTSINLMGRRDPATCGMWENRSICPVTRNLPTRMSPAAFREMCKLLRNQERPVCIQCKGDRQPAGLELIDLKSELKKENDMGSVKRWSDTCGLCGEKKIVSNVKGEKCCSSCEFVFRAAHNHPERLVDALKAVHGNGYLEQLAPKQAVEACDCGSVREDLINAQRRLHAAEQVIENTRIILGIEDKDESILEGAKRKMGMLRNAVDLFHETCKALEVDVVMGDELVSVAEKIMAELKMLRETYSDLPAVSGEIGGREAVLLDLALDVMAGKVSGIDADRIAALR